MSAPGFLIHGMELPVLDSKKFKLLDAPPGSQCALTGNPITQGYPLWKVVPDSTSERLDLTRSGGQWIGEVAARAWKGSWNLGSRLIFEDGTHYHPLIDHKQATKQGRAAWCNLVHEIWPRRRGQNVLIILVTDVKKRVWPGARTGPLGENTPVYIHAPDLGLSACTQIDWEKMLSCLGLVTEIYTAGFSKAAMRETLLWSTKAKRQVGLRQTLEWDRCLRPWRGTYALTLSTIITQKIDSESERVSQPSFF